MSIIIEIITIINVLKNNVELYTTNNDNINVLYKKIIMLTSTIDDLKKHNSIGINQYLQELLCIINNIDIYIKKYKKRNNIHNIVKIYKIKKDILQFTIHIDNILKSIKFELNISNNKTLQLINENTINSFNNIIQDTSLNTSQLNIKLLDIINNNNTLVQSIILTDIKQYCTSYMNTCINDINTLVEQYHNENIELIEQQNEKILLLENDIKLLNTKYEEHEIKINNNILYTSDIVIKNINHEINQLKKDVNGSYEEINYLKNDITTTYTNEINTLKSELITLHNKEITQQNEKLLLLESKCNEQKIINRHIFRCI